MRLEAFLGSEKTSLPGKPRQAGHRQDDYRRGGGRRGHGDSRKPGAGLLPEVQNLRISSATIAVAVVKAAVEEGVAQTEITDVVQQVQDAMWQPVYDFPVEVKGV